MTQYSCFIRIVKNTA